jgi:hypothetical protein
MIMAKLVLGIATSHAPQLGLPAEKWHLLREKDENDTRMNFKELERCAKPGIESELSSDIWKQRYDQCMSASAVLKKLLIECAPDVLVVVGDDQHENLLDDNMPVFCVYRGESIPAVKKKQHKAFWMQAEEDARTLPLVSYSCAPELAEHLIAYLRREDFDIAASNQLNPEIGLGHAFKNLYSQMMPDGRFPIVPFMVNTFFPPNQPTPRRCYNLGAALRRAIDAWDANKKVALVASGGLSHVIIDEELDRITIEALKNKDREKLCTLPEEKLRHGNSEILNWIVLAGAVADYDMSLVDYVPCYRSTAGTGCAMAFAYWPAPA